MRSGRTASLLAAMVLASAGPVGGDNARPALLRDVGIDQRLGETVPLDLQFRDESGQMVRLGDYFGKRPVILSLAYFHCPMLCTLVLNGLASSLGVVPLDIGKDFTVVTVSIDPRETAELAASKKEIYVKRLGRPGAAENWHFLTGDEASIHDLTRAIGFRYAYDAEIDQYAHAAGIVVATPVGRIARYFYGVEFAPRDLRLGLVEASSNRIGSWTDQILLFCYQYDPASGTYGAIAMGSVRAGGIVTVLGIATFVAVMLRRERAGAKV